MKLLAICVVSHERPEFLESQMRSLSCFARHRVDVTTYIFDNSLGASEEVVEIAREYQAILLASPGASQEQNFGKISTIDPHSYYMLLHDDDITVVFDSNMLLARLRENMGEPVLHYFSAISINDKDSRVVASFVKPIKPPPLGNSIITSSFPAFPAWVYPNCIQFFDCFQAYAIGKPMGKYSDVLFIDRLVRSLSALDGFAFDRLSAVLCVLRTHSGQDSFLLDYGLRSRLIWSLSYQNIASRVVVFLFDLLRCRAGWLKRIFIVRRRC